MTEIARPTEAFFTAVGGEATFRKLVHRFYQGIVTDPLISPMYPAEDIPGAEERLTLFLMQYWGGPTTYSDQRGHPRLRMRHVNFAITFEARDRWLSHMRTALDELNLAPEYATPLWNYLEAAAHSMVNAEG